MRLSAYPAAGAAGPSAVATTAAAPTRVAVASSRVPASAPVRLSFCRALSMMLMGSPIVQHRQAHPQSGAAQSHGHYKRHEEPTEGKRQAHAIPDRGLAVALGECGGDDAE